MNFIWIFLSSCSSNKVILQKSVLKTNWLERNIGQELSEEKGQWGGKKSEDNIM